MRKIEVVPFTPIWEKDFIEESRKLQELFGEEIVQVHHIGSTAIHYIDAKP